MRGMMNFISRRKIQIIAAIIITAVMYVAVSHTGASEADATHASTKYFTSITVESGDTLWSIAEEYMTEEYSSVDEYIDEVVYTNNLNNESDIKAGTNLLVPYYKVTDL